MFLQFSHCHPEPDMNDQSASKVTQLPVATAERLVLNADGLEAAKRSLDQGAVTPKIGRAHV